ncbi:hypothetical protein CCH79_00019701 [Gambusia affinis]|uniref:PDZ domain-containing protein n=1 Tax=Gambusia affinis TaxID=33528 RepID=A0A315VYF6_GAMAF|nr:hypothetical protein CCH79_00019701 [Gambusia affinis]
MEPLFSAKLRRRSERQRVGADLRGDDLLQSGEGSLRAKNPGPDTGERAHSELFPCFIGPNPDQFKLRATLQWDQANSWRSPVTSPSDFTATRSTIIQLGLELTSTVQKDCSVFQMEEKILEVSQALSSVCEKTVQATSDPSNMEPSCLEEVHITNVRPGEGLVSSGAVGTLSADLQLRPSHCLISQGMYIKSTYDGLHVVTGTTENSPADQTQRIHAGDEVIQVNQQTVVGWQLKHLVEKMRAESGSITLVLKKRPSGTSGMAAAPLRNLRWRPPLVQRSAVSCEFGCVSCRRVRMLQMSADLLNPQRLQAGEGRPPSWICTSLRLPQLHTFLCEFLSSLGFPPAFPSVTLTLVLLPAGSSAPHIPRLQTRLWTPTILLLKSSSWSRSASDSDPLPVVRKPRPVSMPVNSVLGVSGSSSKRRTQGKKGRDELHRYLSNERIGAIAEEEPAFGLPPRGSPSVRGVDHIRGSRCLVGADLHHSATMPYQEAAATKKLPAATQTRAKTGSTSVLGGWLARLRLFSH